MLDGFQAVMAMMIFPANGIDKLGLEAFERLVLRVFAVNRSDIRQGGVAAALPMRIDEVLKYLEVSQGELLSLIRSGALPRPGRITEDEIAWRRDEIEAGRVR
jgi:predicted DNA-binding transcriptional regulator AlpA